MKGLVSAQNTLGPSSPNIEDLFASKGQRVRNKRQRQGVVNEGKGETARETWKRYLLLRDKELPLDREEMDVAHRKWWFVKGQEKTLRWDEGFHFNWACW